jgi:hypothetical protein
MKYQLETRGKAYEVSRRPVPKMAPQGVQKIDALTGLPLWLVELAEFTNEEDGSSVFSVSVPAPTVPELEWREPVEPVDLEIIPWAQKGRDGEIRSGVAFRAKEIRPVGDRPVSMSTS